MNRQSLAWSLVFVLLLAAHSPAELIISIGSKDIAEGGTDYVDVLIRSDESGGELLQKAIFEIDITPAAGSRLSFIKPQDQGFLSSTSPAYVFRNDSFMEGLSSDATVVVGSVFDDVLSGYDETNSLNNVTVPDQSSLLLARLYLTTVTSVRPTAGDSFTISLKAASMFTMFTYVTGFDDDGNPIYSAPIDFSGTSGTIQITAIPEPSGLVVFLGLGLSVLPWYRRHRRAAERAA